MKFRSRFLLPLLFVAATAALFSCSKSKVADGLRIAVIPKGTTHDFWNAIHAGAVKAKHDLRLKGVDVEVTWRGPLREDDRDFQISVMENFVSSGYNGIVLAPLDDTALVSSVELAARSEVPVVIIDSGINTENYVSFVATDNFKGGQMAAEFMAKQLQEKGNVVVFRYQVGSASTTKREEGFLQKIAEYPNINVISGATPQTSEYGGATVDTAFQKAENMLTREDLKMLNGVFCPNETVTIAMTKALRQVSKAGGVVKIVGFDSGPQSVLDLADGDVQALVVQDPLMMGYQGVMKLVEHLAGQPVDKRVDTGVHLATRENMREPEMARLLHPPVDEILKGE